MSCEILMYDTVGLEIDSQITDKTLKKIEEHIEEVGYSQDPNDISMVWFCVNERSKRFESYELDLIRKLSIDHEIPFVIVLTQCFSKKKRELEKQIEVALPDSTVAKVLAKEYPIDDEILLPAYGLEDLLVESVNGYKKSKVRILLEKINLLDCKRTERIQKIEKQGKECIERYSSAATKRSILPVGGIPFVHGICIKMIVELNDILDIKGGKELGANIFANVVVGVIATPLMAVPLLGIAVAKAYVEAIGEEYLKTLLTVVDKSTDWELNDNELMLKRVQEELKRLQQA